MFFQEVKSCKGQSPLFFNRYGFSGNALSAGLDLDENHDVAIKCDQIDLAVIRPVAAL